MSVVTMCVPGMHLDIVPAPSYDRNSSSPLAFLHIFMGCKILHFMLSLENQQSMTFRSCFSIFWFFFFNYTAVVHRKDISLRNCFPSQYLVISVCLSVFTTSTLWHSFIGCLHLLSLALGKPWEHTAIKTQDIKDALDLVFKPNSEKNRFEKALAFVSNMFWMTIFTVEFH